MSAVGILKPLAAEITVTAANTVYSAGLVRIYASNTAVITITDSANTVTGSFTMASNTVEFVEKDRTSTISATAAIQCVPISYKS